MHPVSFASPMAHLQRALLHLPAHAHKIILTLWTWTKDMKMRVYDLSQNVLGSPQVNVLWSLEKRK